jgi:hypothetical protein
MATNPHETIWPEKLAENGSARVAFVVRDETDASPTTLTTLTLTLYNRTTGAILNSKDATSILNTGGGTYTYDGATGTVEYQMTPADNALEDPSQRQEVHLALFQWTYGGGAKQGWHRVVLTVVGDPKVT